MTKTYLGDAVYAEFDGSGIVLTTEDGSPDPTNRIVLEFEVFQALVAFEARLRAEAKAVGGAP